jgi:hypothetical protein
LKATIKEKDTQIKDLKTQLREKENNQHAVTLTAITRPTASVKNTIKNLQINNLQPITDAEMLSHLPYLTREHIQEGASGYARYALEYPLRNKVLIADAARRKLTWKDEGGNLINDTEGSELSRRFFSVFKQPSIKIIRELMEEIRKHHDQAIEDDDDEQIEICDKMLCKLDDLRREIRKTSEGKPSDLKQDFVKEICGGTPGGSVGIEGKQELSA